jgi:hypothetical protein
MIFKWRYKVFLHTSSSNRFVKVIQKSVKVRYVLRLTHWLTHDIKTKYTGASMCRLHVKKCIESIGSHVTEKFDVGTHTFSMTIERFPNSVP